MNGVVADWSRRRTGDRSNGCLHRTHRPKD